MNNFILLVVVIIVGLNERIGNFFATIDGWNNDEEGTSSDKEAKWAGWGIAVIIY